MDDDAYCAVGCPPDKLCPATAPHIGCAIGTARPHNSNTPFCCEVDANDVFLSTVKKIEEYGNQPNIRQLNQGSLEFRTKLHLLIRNIHTPPQGPSLFRPGEDALVFPPDVVDIQGFTPGMIDDLIKTVHNMVPDSGFEVHLQVADIRRQPRSWRANPANEFVVFPTPLPQLPQDALLLAANLEIWTSQATGFRVVSLMLNALAEPHPMPTADTSLRVDHHFAQKIKRRHVEQIKAAMRATRFVGTMALNTLRNPFEQNVALGQFLVAPGKTLRLTPQLLEIII